MRYNCAVPQGTGEAGPSTVDEAFGPIADPLLRELAAVALRAAADAAALLEAAFGQERVDVGTKSSATDMVSEIDRAAEALIDRTIRNSRPGDGLLAEEGSARPGTTGVRWVVDPLDGTTNFLLGVPAYSVSIAAELEAAPAVGVVVDPSRRETWAAARGGGAMCNGVTCRVSARGGGLANALVGTGFGYRPERRAWQAAIVAGVLPAVRDIRRFGSAALDLCWVAGGRLDAYYEWGLNPWDLSAGRLICEEAGATISILPGRTIVASGPGLHDPLVDLLRGLGVLRVPDGPEPKVWESIV